MKGFSTMIVATDIVGETVIWHLLQSENPDDRISYLDSSLGDTFSPPANAMTLWKLVDYRHIVGWCHHAKEPCGRSTILAIRGDIVNVLIIMSILESEFAVQDVKSSGLSQPPASIVIDRLYIEAGKELLGGISMAVNQKEKPVWPSKHRDYPKLLQWVSIEPIIFYDVTAQRAWLVDGASALLQLV